MDFAVLFLIIGTVGGVISILFAIYLWNQIKKLSTGEGKEREIYNYIRQGAKAYIKREFKTIILISVILAVVIGFALNGWVALSYMVGTITSLVASFIGMDLATRTNVRVTLAAKQGLLSSMRTAFKGGTIMGMLVFGVNIIQIVSVFVLFHYVIGMNYNVVMINIVGCAFGGSFTSVIAQLGGGIYTKAADVGADIVGKIEAGIPEDDHRNPAVIADAVGDNVGDCAGRSADLYETLTSEILSSMILGIAIFSLLGGNPENPTAWVSNPITMIIFFPFVIRCIAAITTVIGYFFVVKTKKGEDTWKILNRGLFLSSGIIAVAYILLIAFIFNSIPLMIAAILGVVANLVLGKIIENYTGFNSKPVSEISKASETGPATNIITGLANGLRAVFLPLSCLVILVLGAYGCGILFGIQNAFAPDFGAGFNVTAGIYGIVIMAMGITSGTGIILSMDGFGPIADNAGGIAEMASMEPEIRDTIDKLDATGNSTKSLTKGFSIFSGATIGFVTIFAYLVLVKNALGIDPIINIGDPRIAVGGVLGIITVFMFVSLLMRAVGKTAFVMIEEVRFQFKTHPGILEDKELPDYARCVDISTVSALKNMILPSMLVISMPIIVGLILGPLTLGAYLITATFVAGGFGLFLNISGASWDNAKKLRKTIRDKAKPETMEAYKAAIIGDTVGDPCKDAAGSSLGSFVTTINNMGLTFFPLFIHFSLLFLLFGIY
ncbi:MAG TPA: sodium-translocating pyrophosphatase [Candidatus Deferrimicrobium sp.]|nr:sodium-translocating pyrophosphatase [Candidatus Deferrimicrobium sp.]